MARVCGLGKEKERGRRARENPREALEGVPARKPQPAQDALPAQCPCVRLPAGQSRRILQPS